MSSPEEKSGWPKLTLCLSLALVLYTVVENSTDPNVQPMLTSAIPAVPTSPIRMRRISTGGSPQRARQTRANLFGKTRKGDEEIANAPQQNGFYDLSATDINGKVIKFSKFKGKVSLIVNVASE